MSPRPPPRHAGPGPRHTRGATCSPSPRLGPGDFHSLRDYVDGDEPLDPLAGFGRSPGAQGPPAQCEGSAAASSCSTSTSRSAPRARRRSSERSPPRRASSTAPTGRVDHPLRDHRRRRHPGPGCRRQTLHLLARIIPSNQPTVPVERDPGEGLARDRDQISLTAAGRSRTVAEPSLTTLGVFTLD